MTPYTVMFVCIQNAGRSQMAAAFLRQMAGDAVVVRSAGTAPAAHVHPEVITAMREVGIDLTGQVPTLLTDELQRGADLAVTMGCGDACPLVRAPVLAWDLADPSGQSIEGVRAVRDEIAGLVRELVARLGAEGRLTAVSDAPGD